MLWIYVHYVVENIYYVLWITCCGQQLPMLWRTYSPMLSTTCTPQHIPCSPHHVTHFTLWLCCGCMLWTTPTYVVDDMFANVVHNIYMFSTIYDMLWSTLTVFHDVPHNMHPQHMQLSTTCIHNVWYVTCCGCMLWRTTSTCCGSHVLWSATGFTDVLKVTKPHTV